MACGNQRKNLVERTAKPRSKIQEAKAKEEHPHATKEEPFIGPPLLSSLAWVCSLLPISLVTTRIRELHCRPTDETANSRSRLRRGAQHFAG